MKKCPWCGQEYSDEVSICVTDQNPLESCDPVHQPPTPQDSGADNVEPFEPTSREIEKTDTLEGFRSLGAFDGFEADRLLRQFVEANIGFQIDRIERRDLSRTSRYRTVSLIEIFVAANDYEKAYKILTADWKV